MAKTGSSKKIIIAAVVVTCAVLLYAVITVKNSGQSGKKRSGNSIQTTFSVKTATAVLTTLHDYIATNGEVEAQSSIEVFPDIGGKVVDVSVSLGSPVKKGQIVGKITCKLGNEVVKEYNICTKNAVAQITFASAFRLLARYLLKML